MKKVEAREVLRDIARFGTVGLSDHCRERMKDRNVDMDDILQVLLWGEITDIERADSDAWRCTVKGNDIEGDELTFIAALNTRTRLVCITVY